MKTSLLHDELSLGVVKPLSPEWRKELLDNGFEFDCIFSGEFCRFEFEDMFLDTGVLSVAEHFALSQVEVFAHSTPVGPFVHMVLYYHLSFGDPRFPDRAVFSSSLCTPRPYTTCADFVNQPKQD